ncbi:MAG: AAA family ATPase [Desulfarculaceae bacterium]|nr:AAA family ATPase [Desulfarculaceae bacterium]MCF8072397.1 AAA family ATPase [Desulfarculaceae bacterium]MCF8100318.1 AAA family ATPase [Desulfarculaceae bacterium]MCF8117915.1 AAA family ATPase [Desulfarculaceae bacterium]
MRRIVVSLLKGGVAKSETAVSLAHGLARKGCRVLLVDTDVQAQCNDMLGVEPEQGLAEVIAGWADPLEALVEARENLHLLAGGVPLAGVKMEIARREMAPEAVLDEALSPYEEHFDLMIMDTAPGWDTLLVNALYCSREVISPVSMEPVALKGLRRFEERLGVIQKYNPSLTLKWIVPTFVDGRVKKTAHIMEQLTAEFGDRLTDPIRYSVKLSEAPEYGRTIFEHDPRGAGAKGYQALVERVLREAPAGESLFLDEQSEPGPLSSRATARPTPEEPPAPAPEIRPVPEPEPEPLPAPSFQAQEAAPPAPTAHYGPRVDLPPFLPPVMPDLSSQPLTAPGSAAGESAPPPRDSGAPAQPSGEAFASQAQRLGQGRAPSAPPPEEGASAREQGKVWDLRERLKKVPVLSQRLKRGLGAGGEG